MHKWHDLSNKRHIYLLVCWRELKEGTSYRNWRFSLETTHEDSRSVFTSLEQLVEYLQKELNNDQL